jgi:predicted metal-dependent HD superfamily phosphohydrolase
VSINMNFKGAFNFWINRLSKELPRHLEYHNVRHTEDVIESVERLCDEENVDDYNREILKAAALCHDTGFLVKYLNNEAIGAKFARETLPDFGYSSADIDKIEQLILATDYFYKPTNHLEEIIKDADLDYLGREDFVEISQGLATEFFHENVLENIHQWNKLQVEFLSNHVFYTKSAKDLRYKGLQVNIAQAKLNYAE